MRHLALALLLAVCASAHAGIVPTSSNGLTATGMSVSMAVDGNQSVVMQASGTWSGTVTLLGTADGVNYITMTAKDVNGIPYPTGISANGLFSVGAGGLAKIMARCSSYSSGTITATLTSGDTGFPVQVGTPAVENVFKGFSGVSSASAATLWTPTTGKTVVVTSLQLCGDVAGAYTVFDSAGATVTAVEMAVNGCSPEQHWPQGYPLAAINDTLTVLGPGSSHVYGVVHGSER